jgi:hypothetical protein
MRIFSALFLRHPLRCCHQHNIEPGCGGWLKFRNREANLEACSKEHRARLQGALQSSAAAMRVPSNTRPRAGKLKKLSHWRSIMKYFNNYENDDSSEISFDFDDFEYYYDPVEEEFRFDTDDGEGE